MTARRFWVCLLLLSAAFAGCVRRTVTINTDPQGATVVLNDQQVGTSPVTVDFTWYGDYDIIARKEGYETLNTHQRLQTPWYELPGLDFISELLVPFTIHDRQEISLTLQTAKPVNEEVLLRDAVEFRERTLFGAD